MDIDETWKKTLAQIEVKLDSIKHFKTWFSYTRLISLDGKTAVIGTHNAFNADFLMKRHKDLIKDTLSYVYGKKVNVKIEFDEVSALKYQEDKSKPQNNRIDFPSLIPDSNQSSDYINKVRRCNLNPKHTFAAYIVGDSNRLAHAAGLAIVSNLGSTYNPLYLHGQTGLGKTHLAQAIANAVLEKDLSKRVLYTHSETFLNDMVQAIKTAKTSEFRTKYRDLDMLIIDDIQLISNWVETQSEFFNTFNALHLANSQIILISDRPPEEIKNLEDRLKSRFQQGLVTDIKPYEFETRLAILEQKQKEFNMNIPNSVLTAIAKLVTANTRELEGALQKINLMSSIKPNHELTFDEVSNILGKSLSQKRKNVQPSDIIKRVAEEYDLKVTEIKGERRTSEIAMARQICMYILREEYKYKLEKVAEDLNRNDHTTVLHAVEKIKGKILTDLSFKNQVNKIIQDLNI